MTTSPRTASDKGFKLGSAGHEEVKGKGYSGTSSGCAKLVPYISGTEVFFIPRSSNSCFIPHCVYTPKL